MSTNPVYVEFHILRSHAPGNMNRDDVGTPKTALFGGHRRLRVSSQCLKRTWRTSPHFRTVLTEDNLGTRTKQLETLLLERLTHDDLSEAARLGLRDLLQQIGRSKSTEGEEGKDETAHLLFLSSSEVDAVADFVRGKAKALAELAETSSALKSERADAAKAESDKADADAAEGDDEAIAEGKKAGRAKKAGGKPKAAKASDATTHKRETLLTDLRKAFVKHLNDAEPRAAADIALFGRFLTSDEFKTVNAALQVAHALGTQKVEIEYDYFSAVDDRGDEPGAGHIGETEFAASVLYQYAVCNLGDLVGNLNGDRAVAVQALEALTHAAARAVPTGKVNGTAAQNPADYVEVVVRRDAPISLANAFLKPVSPYGAHDVMELSVERLQAFRTRYETAYSEDASVVGRFVLDLAADPKTAPAKNTTAVGSVKELGTKLTTLLPGLLGPVAG